MGIAWGAMITVSVIFSICAGTPEAAFEAMLVGAGDALTVCLSLGGAYMLFMGLMNIGAQSGLTASLSKKMRPLVRALMPGARDAVGPITLNMAANLLGLGNAATPFGLSAMQALQKNNNTPKRATDDMCMFIAINASSVQLIPTTVIALRAASGSLSPYEIVIPTLIATAGAAVTAIIFARVLAPLFK